ncbi:ParB/RepB/Spo0J family partition protein [Krasilnikovia sp. M28-CT-15]|uniref:ParB/RepB/Spo0J family partition protein n=1 Tax=Krasilnikovia sp. M28-CT-15 TaxID=3373540 RepID=UPI003876C515
MTISVLPPTLDGVADDGLGDPAVAAQLPQLRLEYLDPRSLVDNPGNLRTAVGEVEDLKASMAEVGILCPLVVVPADGDGEDIQLMIQIGHRRKQAAIELDFPLVPCVIAPDEGAAKLIIAQLAENGHRAGLTATEEAEGFHQLALLDWSPERIAKVRHTSAERVRQSLTLRSLPQQAQDAADDGTLTLDDAAALAEFADQPAAMTRILKATGSPWGVRHAIASERSKQQYTTAKERAKAELILAGVKVTSKPKGWPYQGPAAAKDLVDADGQPLDVEEVRTRPGFAAFVDRDGDTARAVVYCTDPAEWGYTRRSTAVASGTHGLSDDERADRERAQQQRALLREGMQVAASVRAEFYKQTYGTARAARQLFVEALRDAVSDSPLRFGDVDGLYAALGGADTEAVAGAKEDRLRRCLVARWVCAHERNLGHVAAGQDWAFDADAAVFWLDQLVADGYTLSDAETTLYEALTTADDEDGNDDTREADDDEVEDEDAGDPDGEDRDGAQADNGGVDANAQDGEDDMSEQEAPLSAVA